MWKYFYVLYFIYLNVITGELLYPVFTDQPKENVQMPEISQEDLKDAFEYARQQASRRAEMENNYIKAGYGITTPVSADGRLFTSLSSLPMQLHRIQEQLEDATKFIVKKYNLTKIQITEGLPHIVLPENEPLLEQCKKLQDTKPCDTNTNYRTLDGSCNNLNTPNHGKAYGCFRKFFKPAYADGFSSPRTGQEGELPSARVITTNMLLGSNVNSDVATQMFLQWGQILAHDTAHSSQARAGDSNSLFTCCPQNASVELPSSCMPIEIPETDEFYSKFNVSCMSFVRSAACSSDCTLGGFRHVVNQQTSFIDASILYGVQDTEMRSLRSYVKGQLLTQDTDNGQLLPVSDNPDSDQCSRTMEKYSCFKSGDNRNNIQVGVTAVQTILVRQHNMLARILAKNYPNESDEVLFQEVRRIIAAQMQIITYKEFLPILIGPHLMKHFNLDIRNDGYTEYDPSVNPTLTDEYASAAFRFGHGMVQNSFSLVGNNGEEIGRLSLRNNQDHPSYLYEGKLSALVRGLYHQPAQDLTSRFPSSLANHLFEVPGGKYGLDLRSITIQREREHGLPSYPDFLEYCFNISITKFEDLNISIPEEYWKELSIIYRNVKDMDSISSHEEMRLKGALVGPVYACVIAKQFHALKFGDRFYVEHGNQTGAFTEVQLNELRKSTLARIICDNLDGVEFITSNVFRIITQVNKMVSCKDIPGPDFSRWLDK